MKYPTRNNLKKSFPRCHFNKSKKSKRVFSTIEEALKYINKFKLYNYTIYKCKYCNKYHIAH